MKNVLFIDDDVGVLTSLQRVLHRDRARWSMVFVASGAEAVVEIDKGSFDAVVSDLTMPGMDGIQVLEYARKAQPRAVRIILSGNVEKTTHDRVAAAAHEVLSKPCPAATLRACLEKWLA